MSRAVDWSWKLRQAIESIKTRYDHIGRKTGAPFLAVVYPPEAEAAVLKEWRTLAGTLGSGFDVRTIDVLEVTSSVIDELGAENIVEALTNPMPGAVPESELGTMWVSAMAARVKEFARGGARAGLSLSWSTSRLFTRRLGRGHSCKASGTANSTHWKGR